MEKALLLDPLSAIINHYLGDMYLLNERHDDAIRTADNILEVFNAPYITFFKRMGDWHERRLAKRIGDF